MIDDRRAGIFAATVNELNHFGWKSRLQKNFNEQCAGVRDVLSGFEDHRVSAKKCGKHFPCWNREWKIERTDESGNSNRTPEAHRPFISQLTWYRVTEE